MSAPNSPTKAASTPNPAMTTVRNSPGESEALTTSGTCTTSFDSITQKNDNQETPNPNRDLTLTSIILTSLSSLSFGLSSFIVVFSILVMTRISGDFDDPYSVGLFLHIFVYAVQALTSLTGICYFFPRANPVEVLAHLGVLATVLAYLSLITVAVSIFCLVYLFIPNPSDDDIWRCELPTLIKMQDRFLTFLCKRPPLFKGLSFMVLICAWLVGFGMVFLIRFYVGRIRGQQKECDSPESPQL